MNNYNHGVKAGEQYKLGEKSVQEKDEKRDSNMWLCPQGGGINTTPIIQNDTIFFGAYDSYFYALNKDDGILKWKFKTGDVIIGSPALENDVLVFGSQDKFVYALNAETGKLLWKYLAGEMIHTNAVFYKGNIFIGSADGFMYCFSVSGDLLWKYKTGGAIHSSASFVNNKLYFGSYDGYFYCLSIEGELVWKYYVGEWLDDSPAIFSNGEEIWSFSGKSMDYEGPASVCFGAYNKNFYVLDAETGTMQWMRRMDGVVGWGHPTVNKGNIYFGDWSGNLYCLDAKTGSLLWKVLTGGGITNQPMIYSDYVCVGSHDGNFYSLSLEGKVSWKFQTDSVLFCRPAINNNMLYCSLGANFCAIDISTRKIIWKFLTGFGKNPPLEKVMGLMEAIKETQKVFSGWKPEIIKPFYKEDKNVTFFTAPSDHSYSMNNAYKSDSPYANQRKKKKESWER